MYVRGCQNIMDCNYRLRYNPTMQSAYFHVPPGSPPYSAATLIQSPISKLPHDTLSSLHNQGELLIRMRSHGGHFNLTPGPLTLPLTWPAWHFNPQPKARMTASPLNNSLHHTLLPRPAHSPHGGSLWRLLFLPHSIRKVPFSSRDGRSFPCWRVASTLALMRYSLYAWLACPPSQDAAWSFYLYAYPSSVFT